MDKGYQLHEAEEVARAEFPLLEPEPEVNLEPWEREELAASEREYRRHLRSR